MRFFLFLATGFLAAAALATGDDAAWLSGGFGLEAGMGGQQFAAQARPSQPDDSSNLFSSLSDQSSYSEQADLSGGLGLEGHAGYRRIVEAQLELWWMDLSSKAVQDTGLGVQEATQYSRQALESALLLKAGWPMKRWRPLVESGVFGNRTLGATQSVGLVGGSASDQKNWQGLPNEDWGWVAGAGFDFYFPGPKPSFGQRVSLEARYYGGEKDLDPLGPNALKAQLLLGILSLGY
jgi:hypothetical protein